MAISLISPIISIGLIIYKSGEHKQAMTSMAQEVLQLKTDCARAASHAERLHTRATAIEQREAATNKAIAMNEKRIEDLGNKVNSGEMRMVRIETLIEGVAKDIHSIKEKLAPTATI